MPVCGQTGSVGDEVAARVFTGEDRKQYREKVKRCLDVFARMLAEARFDGDRRSIGLEIELNITEETGDPAMANVHVLDMIADEAWQTELAQFNIEINIKPRTLADGVLRELETAVRASLNAAEEGAQKAHARLLMVGILPTLTEQLLDGSALSANPRYKLLNEQIFAARGEDLHLAIDGVERLSVYADTIAPEAACTSVQLHQLVDPGVFARHWNAAQCIAGIQLAVGANSPFFFGRELWRETRIALFEQATDTRPEELKAQGVRPRVWFGERWITSIFDLFEENVRYFPSLLPVVEEEDPVEALERGEVPRLQELRLHNGTVYRWNRPIYDVVRGRPHLRVENRVLPAGPTVVDTLANAAFYYGLVRVLADEDRPLWTQMSFSAAEENFHACARNGIDARVYWPGVGEVPAAELVLRRLLPMAHDGLERWAVDAADRDRLLGIIERRCVEGRNGAAWQAQTFHRLYEHLDRHDALREMTIRYRELMHSNEPVHTWPVS
jgi:gamma-glutamyl:cysteine ligase YbdK (ATP-grasp superfamily)